MKKNQDFISSLLNISLNDEQKEAIYDTEVEFLKKLQEAYQEPIETMLDLIRFMGFAHDCTIVYLIGDIQYVILKNHLEEKEGRELTEEEVLDYVENTGKMATVFTKLRTDNISVEKRALMYQNISSIRFLEENSRHSAFNTPREIEFYEALKRFDFSEVASLYSCLGNLKHRKKLKDMNIEEYIERCKSVTKNTEDIPKR